MLLPRRAFTHWLPVCGMVAVAVCYALFLYRHALNIPYHDDVYDVLRFLIQLTESENWRWSVNLVAKSYNEHRELNSRVFYVVLYQLFGEANFRVLIMVASMALPMLVLVLFLPIRRHPQAMLITLCATLVLVQLRIYGTVLWSMVAFGWLFVYLYGFATLLCLRNVTTVRLMLSVMLATLTTLTLASGQLIWIVGTVSLFHQRFVLQRASTRQLLLWIFAAVVVLTAFSYGAPPGKIGASDYINGFLSLPVHCMAFFFVLLGNGVSQDSTVLAMCAGGILLLTVLVASAVRYKEQDITLELYAWYVILSILAVAAGRAFLVDLEYALSPRYVFPSVLLLAVVTTYLLFHLPEKRRTPSAYNAAALLAAIYWSSSYPVYAPYVQYRLQEMVQAYNEGEFPVYGDPPYKGRAIVKRAISLGIYNPPARPHRMPEVSPVSKARENPGYWRTEG